MSSTTGTDCPDAKFVNETAIFSPDRRYRYTLSRPLEGGNRRAVMFLMLNPSTADETANDPTITRCIRFASDWGYGRLYVGNLSPLRSTDPKALQRAGPEPTDIAACNGKYIALCSGRSDLVVLAYGRSGRWEGRSEAVMEHLATNTPIRCLGFNKDGSPKHPLYIPANAELRPWPAPERPD